MKIYYIVLVAFLLASCGQNKQEKVLLTNITGDLNDVLVVMNDLNWHAASGKILNQVLTEPYYGLPQYEPIFKVIHIKPEGFTNVFQIYRNIIQVNVGEEYSEAKIWYGKDVYAKTQQYLKIEAPNSNMFQELVLKNSEKICEYFRKAELERLQKSYKNHFSEDIMHHLVKVYKLKVDVPANYQLDKKSDNFSWMSFETPHMSQGIFVYSYPYTDTTQFSLERLVISRDSILKLNVDGPSKGSYMQTETEIYPVKRAVEINKNGLYNVTLRGLWRVEGDFMGGPFVSYVFTNSDKTRIICVDGYVYNPRKDKRNYIMQLEAILKTARYAQESVSN